MNNFHKLALLHDDNKEVQKRYIYLAVKLYTNNLERLYLVGKGGTIEAEAKRYYLNEIEKLGYKNIVKRFRRVFIPC